MTGSILYRHTSTGKKIISALRINGEERSLIAWGRLSGRTAQQIKHRLISMTPYDAVFEGSTTQIKLWPVPPSVLAVTRKQMRG